MAGTEIVYQHQFYDSNDQLVVIYIIQEGFSGSTTHVTAGPEPITISWLGKGEGKFSHIKASSAEIEFMSTTSLQYLSLFLASNKAYRVLVYRDGGRVWDGWINPEYYSEPFSSPPYVTKITATDGLALLKNVTMTSPSYTDFKQPIIYYVAYCLRQIGLPDTMRIHVALNLGVDTTTEGVLTGRLFDKLEKDYRTFRDGEDWMNCYDSLVEILKTFNARIFQYGGAWWIERLDQKHTDIDYDVYDMDGVYVSTASGANFVVELTGHTGPGTDIRFLNGANLEVQPAYRAFTVKQEYGHRTNLLKSSNFEGVFTDDDFITDTSLRFWDADKGTETALVEKIQLDQEKVLLMKPIPYVLGQVPSFTAFIRPIETGSPASPFVWTYNEGGTDETAFMEWQYGLGVTYLRMKYFANWAVYEYSAPWLLSYVNVFINCSGTIYQLWSGSGNNYNNDEYEWVETISGTPTTYDYSHLTLKPTKSEWNDLDVALRMPEAEQGNTQTYVGFMIEISSPNLNAATMAAGDGIYFKDITLSVDKGTVTDRTNKEGVESRVDDPDRVKETYIREYTETIDTDNLLEPETYEFRYGDTPPPFAADGYGLVNKYVIFDSGGVAVNKFGTITYPQYSLYQYIHRVDLSTAYRRPQFKLRGTLKDTVGATVGFQSVIKDYDQRYYSPTGLRYNMKEVEWEGEWLQIYDDSGTGEFNDDFNNDFWI